MSVSASKNAKINNKCVNKILKWILLFLAIASAALVWRLGYVVFTTSGRIEVETGLNIKDFEIVETHDTRGGFHGDGTFYLILDCSKNVEKARKVVGTWNELPLTENLQLIMYGGKRDGVNYGYELAKDAKIPQIKNGCYLFLDRHSEATQRHGDYELFDRYSYNFSIAFYDYDTNRMYYFRIDT